MGTNPFALTTHLDPNSRPDASPSARAVSNNVFLGGGVGINANAAHGLGSLIEDRFDGGRNDDHFHSRLQGVGINSLFSKVQKQKGGWPHASHLDPLDWVFTNNLLVETKLNIGKGRVESASF